MASKRLGRVAAAAAKLAAKLKLRSTSDVGRSARRAARAEQTRKDERARAQRVPAPKVERAPAKGPTQVKVTSRPAGAMSSVAKKRPGSQPSRKLAPSPAQKKVLAKKKATATRGAAARAAETKRFADASSKRYGKNSRTTKRLKELAAQARRFELEARRAKTLSGKQRARAKAGKARKAAALSFKSATREATHGQVLEGGFVELTRWDASSAQANTFTSYEHARHSAGSVLSLLESRPGVVGILSFHRVSNVASVDPDGLNAAGGLSAANQERAELVADELGLVPRAAMDPRDRGPSREDFFDLLIEAELYGIELELDVEQYTGETA